jgi:hypothetical protein
VTWPDRRSDWVSPAANTLSDSASKIRIDSL